jgi:hypothetical protein
MTFAFMGYSPSGKWPAITLISDRLNRSIQSNHRIFFLFIYFFFFENSIQGIDISNAVIHLWPLHFTISLYPWSIVLDIFFYIVITMVNYLTLKSLLFFMKAFSFVCVWYKQLTHVTSCSNFCMEKHLHLQNILLIFK